MLTHQLEAEKALSRFQATNTAALLARGTAATLDKARLAIDSVADRLEADMAGAGLQRAGIRPMVDRSVERVPDLQTIGLFDQAGAQICGEPDDLCRGVRVADRDYFLAYQSNPAAGPGILSLGTSTVDWMAAGC